MLRDKIRDIFSRIDFRPFIMYSMLLVWAGFGALFLIFSPGGEETAEIAMEGHTGYELLEENESPGSPALMDGFNELLEQNSDTVGYIRIEGTALDCPVVQADDNIFYRSRGFDGQPSESGAVFMDCSCNLRDIGGSGNMVLYGDADRGAFSELLNYEDRSFFEENRIIEFSTINHDYFWEIFSAHFTDTSTGCLDTGIMSKHRVLDVVRECASKSIHSNDTVLKDDDTVLTLAACGGQNYKPSLIVHARLIE